MTYQVFARKYRPQVFDEIVGQEHIVRTLKNAIEQNRLAHAYLFVGPRGTGKTSTARIIAKALNCEKGPTVNPCGTCDACREIAAGTSLDVLEIDGASNNGVEQVRELRDNVRFAPTRGKFKIYIIDEVHMLTSAAFNALLKTLEEPPEHVKFIFATTEPQKVLPTILSRCQRFDLCRIPAPLIAEHLQYIASQEGITLTPEAATTVARGAEGGLRDAESMLDQLVAFCGNRIQESDVLTVFGFTAQQTIVDMAGAILDQNSATALGLLYDQEEAGKDLIKLLGDLLSHFRNLLVYQVDPSGIRTELTESLESQLQIQIKKITREQLLLLIDLFAATEGRMKWAPNKRLHFEIGIIKAVETLGQASLDEILEVLLALREGREPELPKRTLPQRAVSQKSNSISAHTPERKSRTEVSEATVPQSETPVSPIAAPKETEAPKSDTSSVEEAEPETVVSSLEQNDSEAEPIVSSDEQSADDTEKTWFSLLEAVQEKQPTLYTLLSQGAPLTLNKKLFRIAFPAGAEVGLRSLERRKKAIQSFLEKITDLQLQVEFIPSNDVKPLPLKDEKKQETEEVSQEDFLNDPKIKMALEIFKGQIISQ